MWTAGAAGRKCGWGADPWEPKPAACASFLDESVSETELTPGHSHREASASSARLSSDLFSTGLRCFWPDRLAESKTACDS